MMKERSWNLQGMESIENSMDPRAKEKHEEEHEDSKRERKARTTSHCIENHKTTSRYELTKSNQAEELKVVMKNSVWKTYE
jgi:hypothetical protein